MNRKIYVVGGAVGYANWMEGEIVPKMHQSDLVVFTGGEDVSPELYGEERHPTTQCNGVRDGYEMYHFEEARIMKKKMVGICRGSQFLCVMAGGKLVQDQERQPGYHPMNTHDGKIIRVSSTHHQAQWPWNLPRKEFFVLGYTKKLSRWHHDAINDEMVDGASDATYGVVADGHEAEICYYPKIRALAIQSHPEYYFVSDKPEFIESIKYFQNLLNLHMEDKL
jgi:putative glutamine amidotransferase